MYSFFLIQILIYLFLISPVLLASSCSAASIEHLSDSKTSRPVYQQIIPTANSHKGDWGPEAFCPDNTWARGFKLKVEPDQGDLKDDSSLNAVQLECFNSHDQYVGSAASLVGEKGDWKSDQYCGSESFINGVRFRSKGVSIKSNFNFRFTTIYPLANYRQP